jgi:ribose 5-phosphate isomerase A
VVAALLAQGKDTTQHGTIESMSADQSDAVVKNAAGGDVALLHEAARQAAALVQDGMALGLGTGRAASLTVRLLAERVREEGLHVRCVPTSERTAALARELNLPLTTLEDAPRLDLALDGADEVDPQLNLLKGLGGALLREKLVARAALPRLVILVDESKLVPRLGMRAAVPVEVVPFGWRATARALEGLGLRPVLRRVPPQQVGGTADGGTPSEGADEPYATDGGNFILDCHGAGSADLLRLAPAIKAITGVVDHGIFAAMAQAVYVATGVGTARVLSREGAEAPAMQRPGSAHADA